MVKNPPINADDKRDVNLIPRSRNYLGGRPVNPLQFSCLKNTMDRGAWQAAVCRITKSQIRLKLLAHKHTKHTHIVAAESTLWDGLCLVSTDLGHCGALLWGLLADPPRHPPCTQRQSINVASGKAGQSTKR